MSTFDRKAFADAATFASRALPRSASIPTLTGLRVTGSKSGVSVSAFDFDTYAEATVTHTADDFDVLLPGRAFTAYLAGMAGTTVDLNINDRHAELVCGAARVTLPLLSLDDYPTAPVVPASVGSVDAQVLADAFASAKEAIDPNDAVQTLRGIVVEIGAVLTFAGVHRHRMSVREVDGWNGEGEANLIVPLPVVDAVKALSGTVAVGHSDNMIAFGDADRVVTSRLIDGQPNQWRRVADAVTPTTTVTVDRAELAAALKWISAGDTRKDTFGHCRLTVDSDTVTIALWGAEGLGASTEVEAKVDGDGLEMGWKAENLLSGLAATDAATVTIGLSTPTKAVLLTAESDPGFRYIAMPVQLPEAK